MASVTTTKAATAEHHLAFAYHSCSRCHQVGTFGAYSLLTVATGQADLKEFGRIAALESAMAC